MSLRDDELKKIRRLTTVPDDFLAKIPVSESQVYDKVVELLSRLEVKGDNFVISNKNLQIASEISTLLKSVLISSDYTKYVTDFAKEFDTQAVVNNKLFETAFPKFTQTDLMKSVVNISKRETIDLLLNRASDTDFISPLRTTIEQAVINGSGYGETLKAIRTFIEGNEDVDGALLRYSKTYAHDSFAIADSAYSSVIADELDAEWFKYLGDDIKTTRPFCEQRANQFFHYKEINSWFTTDPQPSGITTHSPWAGMIPGTNKDTFYSYRGGFNCRHSILAQSISVVPKTVIERNIASGNFIPSDFEKEKLGL